MGHKETTDDMCIIGGLLFWYILCYSILCNAILPSVAFAKSPNFFGAKVGTKTYANQDLELARKVMAHDDVVDDYFAQVKNGIIDIIAAEPSQGEYALDLLMIAKYFERIGDHCTNIAEWVEFSVTGVHKDCQ